MCAGQGKGDAVRVKLSPQQRVVLSHLLDGKREHDIADEMGISHGTVKNHIQGIYIRLGAEHRIDLMARLMTPTDEAKRLMEA